MRITFSNDVKKCLAKVKQKDSKLAERIEKQLALFAENPKHPSLRTHKLSGNLQNMWSISITMNVRMVYLLLDNDSVIFIKAGTHDEVYGK